MKDKFVDKHIIKSFHIEKELWEAFDALAREQGHGAKTELINEGIRLLLERHRKNE